MALKHVKGFFKRNVLKGREYKCYFGGDCMISKGTRNLCKSCRFQKCLRVGMTFKANKVARAPKTDLDNSSLPNLPPRPIKTHTTVTLDLPAFSFAKTAAVHALQFLAPQNPRADPGHEQLETCKNLYTNHNLYLPHNSINYTNPESLASFSAGPKLRASHSEWLLDGRFRLRTPPPETVWYNSVQTSGASATKCARNSPAACVPDLSSVEINSIGQLYQTSSQLRDSVKKFRGQSSVIAPPCSLVLLSGSHRTGSRCESASCYVDFFDLSTKPGTLDCVKKKGCCSRPAPTVTVTDYLNAFCCKPWKVSFTFDLPGGSLISLGRNNARPFGMQVPGLMGGVITAIEEAGNIVYGAKAIKSVDLMVKLWQDGRLAPDNPPDESLTAFQVHDLLKADIEDLVAGIVCFAARIPGMADVCSDDVKTLLNQCVFEMWMVQSAAFFVNNESFILFESTKQPVRCSLYWISHFLRKPIIDAMMRLADEINNYQFSVVEFHVLKAMIVTCPKRKNLKNVGAVVELHEYLRTALHYLFRQRPHCSANEMLANVDLLLQKLTHVNDLYNQCLYKCYGSS